MCQSHCPGWGTYMVHTFHTGYRVRLTSQVAQGRLTWGLKDGVRICPVSGSKTQWLSNPEDWISCSARPPSHIWPPTVIQLPWGEGHVFLLPNHGRSSLAPWPPSCFLLLSERLGRKQLPWTLNVANGVLMTLLLEAYPLTRPDEDWKLGVWMAGFLQARVGGWATASNSWRSLGRRALYFPVPRSSLLNKQLFPLTNQDMKHTPGVPLAACQILFAAPLSCRSLWFLSFWWWRRGTASLWLIGMGPMGHQGQTLPSGVWSSLQGSHLCLKSFCFLKGIFLAAIKILKISQRNISMPGHAWYHASLRIGWT